MPFIGSAEYNFAFASPQAISSGLVTSGLVIQLDAYLASSYPGTGTSITDITGGYTHTLTDGAVYQTLYGVKTFDCTSASKRVAVNGTGPTLPASGYTYVTWGRVLTSSAGWRTLFRTSPNDHPILIELSTDNLGFYDNDTNAFIDSGYDVTPIEDAWAQFTVVGGSNSSIFYINGTQVGSVAYGANGNTHWLWGGLPSQPFGYVANLYYYNRKLNAAEVTQMYNYLAPRFPNIVTTNLALYYDPSNDVSYPGSGTTLTNLTGTGLNGTMTALTYTTPYLTYNGTTSQVSIADNASLEPGSGDWSIEVWIRYTTIAGKTRTYVSKANGGGGSADWGYGLRTNSANNTTYMEVGNGTTSIASPTTSVTTGVWYQIVGVWTNVASKSIALYKNGALVGSSSHAFASVKNTTTPLYLGNYNGNEFAQQFEGNMGIVRIYSKALSAGEVQNNYDANKALYGLV
jgi:hypothetical protein